jgi:pimeloyl-ACP methyl ester carboxylesterase
MFRDGWGPEWPSYALTPRFSGELDGLQMGEPRLEAGGAVRVRLCSFDSPAHSFMPEPSKRCHFELVEPARGDAAATSGPRLAVVFLAATGDEHFDWRRRTFAEPLALQRGVTSVIVQIPLYGARRRVDHGGRGDFRDVYDFFLMGLGTVEEARALLYWLRREGYERLAITGISMGGCIAAWVALFCPDLPLGVASCIGSHSPEPVYLDGAFARCVAWNRVGDRERLRLLLRERVADPFCELGRAWLADAQRASGTDAPAPLAYVQVSAMHDHFIGLDSTLRLFKSVSSAERCVAAHLEWLPGGHVSSFILFPGRFRAAIERALDMLDHALTAQGRERRGDKDGDADAAGRASD